MKLFSAVLLFCLVATCFAGPFSRTKKFDSLRAWGDDLSNRAVDLEERIFDDEELGALRAEIESRSRDAMDQTAALKWEEELARIGKGKGSMKTCSFNKTKWDCLVPSTSKGRTE